MMPAASPIGTFKERLTAGMTAIRAEMLNETRTLVQQKKNKIHLLPYGRVSVPAHSGWRRGRPLLSDMCFGLDHFLEYLQIILRMLVDEPFDLLGGEFGEFGVHFKILDPFHGNAAFNFCIKPHNFHIQEWEQRVPALSIGEFLVL